MQNLYVNASDIASYAICPWLVYYRKILGIYKESTLPMACGSFEHEARRRVFRSLVNTQNHSTQLGGVVAKCVKDAYDFAVSNYPAYLSTLGHFKLELTGRISREVEQLDFPWNPLPVGVEIPLSSKYLRQRGRVDCLYKTYSGLTPCDYKTGSAHSVEADELQVAVYGQLTEDSFQSPVHTCIIYYTAIGEKHIVRLTDSLRDRVNEISEIIQQMILTQGQPQESRLGRTHCKTCSHRSICEGDRYGDIS